MIVAYTINDKPAAFNVQDVAGVIPPASGFGSLVLLSNGDDPIAVDQHPKEACSRLYEAVMIEIGFKYDLHEEEDSASEENASGGDVDGG